MELAQAIQKAHNGEPEGFQMIFQYTADSVYFRATILLGQRENPLVFVHDVYVLAFQAINTLHSPSDLRVWLGEILYGKLLRQTYTGTCDPLPIHYDNENVAALMKQMERLPMEQEVILVLSYYDGCSTGQIAQIIKQDEMTVKRALKSARTAIEDGVNAEREARGKINAAALSFALCQTAQQTRIPPVLVHEIFHKICVDAGLESPDMTYETAAYPIPRETTVLKETSETVAQNEETVQKAEKECFISEGRKKEAKQSKTIFGKLFHNLKN